MNTDVRLCFVAYQDNEQDEAGDTLLHTFTKPLWTPCRPYWFYFHGEIAGQPSPSTSPYFQVLLPDCHTASIDNFNWPWYLGRWENNSTYLAVHNALTATMVIPSWGRYVFQESRPWVNGWNIYRYGMLFDTAFIPNDAIIDKATLTTYFTTPVTGIDHIAVVNAPFIHDPPILGDYGYIGSQTTPFLGWWDKNEWHGTDWYTIELNEEGRNHINMKGVTRWALRAGGDALSIPPPEGQWGVILWRKPITLNLEYHIPCP